MFKRAQIIFVSYDDLEKNLIDERSDPYAILRAKSELLAEFLGCTDDEAEAIILERVTQLDE